LPSVALIQTAGGSARSTEELQSARDDHHGAVYLGAKTPASRIANWLPSFPLRKFGGAAKADSRPCMAHWLLTATLRNFRLR
jgi:hypothetical protein